VNGNDESLAVKAIEKRIDEIVEVYAEQLWQFRLWDEITETYSELLDKGQFIITKRNLYGNNWKYLYGSGLGKPFLLCTSYQIDCLIKNHLVFPNKKTSMKKRYRKTFEKEITPHNYKAAGNYVELYYEFDEFIEFKQKQIHLMAGLKEGNLLMAINMNT
jgi:hypothetical protein